MTFVICPNCSEETPSRYMYCFKCGASLSGKPGQKPRRTPSLALDGMLSQASANDPLLPVDARIQQLEGQVQQLKNQLSQLSSEVYANRAGSSALQSTNFLNRAFAIWGHYFVAQLIISIGLVIIYLCIFAAIGGSILGN